MDGNSGLLESASLQLNAIQVKGLINYLWLLMIV